MSCCSPDRSSGSPEPASASGDDRIASPSGTDPAGVEVPAGDRGQGPAVRPGLAEVVALEGGTFVMGDDSPWSYPADGEGPARRVRVSPFGIDATAVSNADFAAFVEDTGYVTEAERFEWSFVFGGLLPAGFGDTRGVVGAEWWRQVFGASWRHPEGPHSDVDGREDHPVLHVSWNDAMAFAAWAGKRLPSEAEWELAGRAGSTTTFPWGDELEPGGQHRANVFQGVFPAQDTGADGWVGTCPVDAFEPNAFGLWNMIGNVWEWTADRWSAQRFDAYAGAGALQAGPAGAAESAVEESGDAVIVDPRGPSTGEGRTLKGGSYLCHASYCRRYRPAARMSSTQDSSAGNIGFRCAVDLGSHRTGTEGDATRPGSTSVTSPDDATDVADDLVPVGELADDEPGDPGDASPRRGSRRRSVDGRTARRDRNRDAVLDAVLELFTEDMFMPGANEVAERSGVSPRSVYRYFEDAEALTRAAIDRQLELVEPLFHIPAIGEGPLDERIERFVACRLRLWDAVGPTARAASFRASSNDLMREQFESTRELLRGQAQQMFAPELDDLATPEARAVLGSVDVLCEFAGLDHLRRVRNLTDAQTRDILVRSLRLLLDPR